MKLKIGGSYYLDKPESFTDYTDKKSFYIPMRSSSVGILKKIEVDLSGKKVAILKRMHRSEKGSVFTADPKDLKIAKYTGLNPYRCRKCGRLISRSNIRYTKRDKYKGFCDYCIPKQGSLKLL